MRRPAPRSLASALREVTEQAAPATALARVQGCWRDALGEQLAAEAEPVSEREGTVTVACRSATWAQELELLGPELTARLNAALTQGGGGLELRGLRFVVGGSATPSERPSERHRRRRTRAPGRRR